MFYARYGTRSRLQTFSKSSPLSLGLALFPRVSNLWNPVNIVAYPALKLTTTKDMMRGLDWELWKIAKNLVCFGQKVSSLYSFLEQSLEVNTSAMAIELILFSKTITWNLRPLLPKLGSQLYDPLVGDVMIHVQGWCNDSCSIRGQKGKIR